MSDLTEQRIRELEDTTLAFYVLLFSQIVAAESNKSGVIEATEKLVAEQRKAFEDLGENGACQALDKLLKKLNCLKPEATRNSEV